MQNFISSLLLVGQRERVFIFLFIRPISRSVCIEYASIAWMGLNVQVRQSKPLCSRGSKGSQRFFFFGKTEEKKEERRSIIGAKPSNETDENSPFPYICYWVVYDVDVPL